MDVRQILEFDHSFDQFHSALARGAADNGYITIWGDILDTTTEPIALYLLSELAKGRKEVTIILCSEGGDENCARALIGVMELCKNAGMIIKVFGAGIIASAGFDIFIAGSKGYRFVHELSMLMTHATSAEIRNKKEVRLTETLDELTLTKYTKINKKTRDQYLETGDWFMSPEEGVQRGVVDAVVKIGEGLPTGPVIRVKHEVPVNVGEDTEER